MADGVWQTHRTRISDQETKGVRSVMEDLAIEKAHHRRGLVGGRQGHHRPAIRRTLQGLRGRPREREAQGRGQGRQGVGRGMDVPALGRGDYQDRWRTLSQKCPNWRAPLKVDRAGICKDCKANVMAGDQDWVLVRIDEASDD